MNIDSKFCTLDVVVNDPNSNKNGHLLPAAVRWARAEKCYWLPRVADTRRIQTHLPNNFATTNLRSAIMLRFLLESTIDCFSLVNGTVPNQSTAVGGGTVDVPIMAVPIQTSRSTLESRLQRHTMPWEVSKKTTVAIDEYDEDDMQHDEEFPDHALTQDVVNEWSKMDEIIWSVHRPVDLVEEILGLMQPITACITWDQHGAAAARAISRFASIMTHVMCDEWQKGPSCLSSWLRSEVLAGSPRGHHLNVYLRYFAASENYIEKDVLDAKADNIRQTFADLGRAREIPTRSQTPDGATTLHGTTLITQECKSQQGFAGAENQCIVMCNQFAWTDLPTALGIHTSPTAFRLQVISLPNDDSRELVRAVKRSRAFDVQNKKPKPNPITLPDILVDTPGGVVELPIARWVTEAWNFINPRVQEYLVAAFQMVAEIHAEQVALQLHEPATRKKIEDGINNRWANDYQIPHFVDENPKIPPEVQGALFLDLATFTTPVAPSPAGATYAAAADAAYKAVVEARKALKAAADPVTVAVADRALVQAENAEANLLQAGAAQEVQPEALLPGSVVNYNIPSLPTMSVPGLRKQLSEKQSSLASSAPATLPTQPGSPRVRPPKRALSTSSSSSPPTTPKRPPKGARQ